MSARRLRLAQRRKTVGFSQERLAEVVGVDRSTVVRWERAETDPQPWHRPRLAAALNVSVEELARLLADFGDAPGQPNERLDYVLRHPSRVDLVAVAYLREHVQRLDARYEHTPSALLLAETGQVYGQAVFLRQHAPTGPVRRELMAGIAESAILMGQLVWDASHRRDYAASNVYFDEAVSAARNARDVVTKAHAVLRKSYVALYGTRNPAAGLALASRAASTSADASQVITGLARLHAGEASAMLGDTNGCTSALGTAAEHLASIGADDPAALLFCPSQYGRLAGSCQLHLGRPDKAQAILEASRQLLPVGRKANAIVMGNLALASIRQGHIDAGAARLHEAIDVIELTRAGGGLNVVFTAARELRPWRNEPMVQEVNDRLLTLMTAV
ncbi:MAG TPA: helix-turn-helix transcriptional regulator [Catenuloplanes sp.]|jgi:transcriptional regulator with XRE-family HTH domain